MTGISLESLIEYYPHLYHMAEADSWKSIKDNGLLSASALLDLFEINGRRRFAIESCHRPDSVVIEHPKYGRAVIRDQKPMRESSLLRCLDGIEPRQWYELLNKKVFLWATLHRLESLLAARAYRKKEHLVLRLDATRLLSKYKQKVWLSPINSGSTIYKPSPRSIDTFQPITSYPFEERKSKRGNPNAVAEMAFDCAIPDISEYVLKVEKRRGGRVTDVIWEAH